MTSLQTINSLAGMDANKKQKRCSKNEKLAKAQVVKQQKSDKPEPVLPEKIKKTDLENHIPHSKIGTIN